MRKSIHRHIERVQRATLQRSESMKTDDFFQVAAGKATIAESFAALDCIARGQVFVRQVDGGFAKRDPGGWSFLDTPVSRTAGAAMATIALDLARFPDVVALRQELDNVRSFKNDECCYEWNLMDLGVRTEIVAAANAARERMPRIREQVMAADRTSPEGRDLWAEWVRLSNTVARAPVGLGDYLEAVPGRTVFNARPSLAVRKS